MKYDSGMTRFHKDILASIRYMLKDDTEITEITEKFKAEDGPPTPLREYREYLKAAYGKPCRSHCGNGVHYVCHPTKGIGIMFDRILNNSGDTELTLSWSQVAKFIRDNWEDIFPPKKANISMDIEELDLPVKLYNTLKRNGINTVEDYKQNRETVANLVSAKSLKPLDAAAGLKFLMPGDWVDKDMLGDELTFDDLENMIGQLIILNSNAKSRDNYHIVLVEKIIDNGNTRRLICYDGKKQRGLVDRHWFDCGDEKAWTIKNSKVPEDKQLPAVSDSEEKINMSKESYREVLKQQFPQLTDEMINRSACCPESFFSGDNIPFSGICGYKGDTSLCPACWDKPCEGTYNGDIFDPLDWVNYSEGDDKKQPTENEEKQPPAEQTSDSPAAFDYSILDNDDAEAVLGYRERHLRRQQSYYLDEAKDLAEIQPRLAKYGSGVWVKWIETETEYSTKTAYNLIDVYNRFCKFTKTEQETFIALPKTLQYDISAKSAPPKLVEQVMSGDITTHDKYIKLKKQLEKTQEDLELEKQSNKDLKDANDHIFNASKKNREKWDAERIKNAELTERNTDLEKRIRELESRPIDVTFDPDEVNKRVEEAVNRINTETERTLSAERKEFADTLNEKDDRIWALEDKIRELEKSAPSQKKYIAVLTEEQVRKYGIKTIVEVK